jgi:hypothetical protein
MTPTEGNMVTIAARTNWLIQYGEKELEKLYAQSEAMLKSFTPEQTELYCKMIDEQEERWKRLESGKR